MHRSRLARAILLSVALAAGTAGVTVPAASGSAVATCHGIRATVVGTPDADELRGTPGPDVVVAGRGGDVVEGLGGDDIVCGGRGADVLVGGFGDDRLYGGPDGRLYWDYELFDYVGDRLQGGPGNDLLDTGYQDTPWYRRYTRDTVFYGGAVRGMRVDLRAGTASGQGHDRLVARFVTLVGSPHDDRLEGSSGSDDLRAGPGADDVRGRGGPDTIRGGRGDDVLSGWVGNDVIVAGKGDDTSYGRAGNDRLRAQRGRDRSYGGADSDEVSDTFVPAKGQVVDGGGDPGDVLYGLEFVSARGEPVRRSGTFDVPRATIRIDHPSTLVVRMRGFLQIYAPNGVWRMNGSAADEDLGSAEGADAEDGSRVVVRAAGGDDILVGTGADDVLAGGTGHDDAYPNGGHDLCRSIEEIHDTGCG